MDAIPWMEFGKLFGFPALCLLALGLGIWRTFRWWAIEIIKPTVDDVRGVIRAAGPAILQMRDDVADVKETGLRMERKQSEHFEVCAGIHH